MAKILEDINYCHDLFEKGLLDACFIKHDKLFGISLYVNIKNSSPFPVRRRSGSIASYKSYNAALSAAKKIGFTFVTVHFS
jgi:hypothetical protein